jgi:adenylate cyclase
MASSDAFESMLEQALDAFTRKIGELMAADKASLWLLDEARGELWTKVAQDASGQPYEIRIPRDRGIAGAVASSGLPLNIPDAYADPRFDSSADRDSGYHTHNILCMPILDDGGRVFAVAQLLNKAGGTRCFDAVDERRFRDFVAKMGVLLQSWGHMSGAAPRPGSPGAVADAAHDGRA